MTDIETFEKLVGYTEVNVNELKVGDHIRYASNKYKQDGSKEGQAVSKFDYTTGAGE